ncbi:MAG: hypothetical protein IJ856_05855 [Candidatus Methanomethylophilaceae archaeon]|nr:hypothetical protein [Candidatus Methanomethylophilaceae archaeon]
MLIQDDYEVYFKGDRVGSYYVYDDGTSSYYAYDNVRERFEGIPDELCKDRRTHGKIRFFKPVLKEENRVPGTRKHVFVSGDMKLVRIPKDVGRFYVYRLSAE